MIAPNSGSYQNIPAHVRSASEQQLHEFIDSHIEARRSFAFENALRTDTRFQQIRRAKEMGFRVLMDYLAAGPVEGHIRRVMNRAALGGHYASERKLRDIMSAYEESADRLHSRRTDTSGSTSFESSIIQGTLVVPTWFLAWFAASQGKSPRKFLPGLKPLLSIQGLRSTTYAVSCAAEAAKDCMASPLETESKTR